MHFFFLTRGVKQQRDLFVKFMETQMWKWKRKNLTTGKDEFIQVQGGLRPLELWEYIFPDECLDEVLTVLELDENGKNRWALGRTKSAILRKALGKGTEGNKIKPVPKFKKAKTNKYVELRGVAVYPIGIKEDAHEAIKEWDYQQEML